MAETRQNRCIAADGGLNSAGAVVDLLVPIVAVLFAACDVKKAW